MAQPNLPSSPPLPPACSSRQPPLSGQKKVFSDDSSHPVHKTFSGAANLANLLPTGTVLAFRTLTPSFSNKGICQMSNKFLTASLVALCSIVCFLSSFTDSFVDGGMLYYGIATLKGMYIFNEGSYDSRDQELEGENTRDDIDLTKFKIRFIDFVHAFVSLLVFLIFAFSDSDVQNCFFPQAGENVNVLLMNLPLGAGVFSSFLFTIFPTTRRGIGYAEIPRSFR